MKLQPNIEALVSSFLRAQTELVELVEDRVYTAIPKPPSTGAETLYPLVRVTLLIDTPTGAPLWSVAHEVQVEAFGGSKFVAWRIASTARQLIADRLAGVHPEGIVNGVTPGGMLDLPDDSFSPAKPRYIFTSTVHAHPAVTVSP